MVGLAKAFLRTGNWKEYEKGDDYLIKTKISDSNILCVKSQAQVPLSMADCLDHILDLDKRCLFDNYLDDATLI